MAVDQVGWARATEALMEGLRDLVDRYCHACEACGVPLDVINDFRQFGNWMFLGFRQNANSKIHSYGHTATLNYRMETTITDALRGATQAVLLAIESKYGARNEEGMRLLSELAEAMVLMSAQLDVALAAMARGDPDGPSHLT